MMPRVVGSSRMTSPPDPSTRRCARCGLDRQVSGNPAPTCRGCANKTTDTTQPHAPQHAPCQTHDPERWFPNGTDTEGQRRAKELCATCPVVVECLQYALDNGEDYGVWGGLSEQERANARRRARAAADRTTPPVPPAAKKQPRGLYAARARERLDPDRVYSGVEIGVILDTTNPSAAIGALSSRGVIRKVGHVYITQSGRSRTRPTYQLVVAS